MKRPIEPTPRPVRGCDVPDCHDVHFARGWCHKHYERWLVHGHPNARESATHRTKVTPRRYV